MFLHDVEEVGGVVAHGEAESSGDESQESVDGGRKRRDVEDGVPAVVEVAREASQSDALADACGPGDECEALDFEPHVEGEAKLALPGGVVHLGGPHVLGEGYLGEAEVGA